MRWWRRRWSLWKGWKRGRDEVEVEERKGMRACMNVDDERHDGCMGMEEEAWEIN